MPPDIMAGHLVPSSSAPSEGAAAAGHPAATRAWRGSVRRPAGAERAGSKLETQTISATLPKSAKTKKEDLISKG